MQSIKTVIKSRIRHDPFLAPTRDQLHILYNMMKSLGGFTKAYSRPGGIGLFNSIHYNLPAGVVIT